MSFRSLNSPPLVAAAGAVIVAGLPFVQVGAVSMAALKVANIVAFVTNTTAVSIPGRMDGDQDARMRQGDMNPHDESTPLNNNNNIVQRNRTLVAPAGWAFAIWGPIYLGEAIFCGAQFWDPTMTAAVPSMTAPFVAANLTQSLWCASFRSSYSQGWHKYISVFMLGGTAFSLSQVPFADIASPYMIPLTMHFGWTTAATLVNLNGSLAMGDNTSERTIIAAGHLSAVVATALGIGITVTQTLPVYGFTVAWALAACSSGMKVKPDDPSASSTLKAGAKVQQILLLAGSVLSAGASIYTLLQ
ncbi:expressed unknown protein [Seminavis robusta]|uniref:Uncharacterized protein n=1 Tax=Seminavis robusta TaxID=568900 RepID=A0A9N8HKJ4_9STRA|nr:expressed unknown protein [Seminavis robusta]|eukprot:Sro761_g198460.1 n/a (302) ;mRNA; f:2508-3413